MFIGDVTQFAKVFFLIYILQNLKNFSHDFKILKKKKRFSIKQTKIALKETWNIRKLRGISRGAGQDSKKTNSQ